MAVDLLGSLNFSGFGNIMIVVLYWILGMAMLAFTVGFTWWWLSFKVIYIIRPVMGDRTLVLIDRAKIIRKKGQPIRWKLRKRGDFVPVPPKEALDITTKGKQFVEAYYTEDGEYHYIYDKQDRREKIGSLHPVSSTDKEFYAQQVEEGQKYRKKPLSEILLQIAPILAIIIILVVFMVFFDKTVQPAMSIAGSLNTASNQIVLALEAINSCTQNVVIP